jgi:uncharacterized protein YjbI with pentapeptide repeats
VLHILPYFISESYRQNYNYRDEDKLLDEDRRQLWWQKYGKATGKEYEEMPQELAQDNLTDITEVPLLNYLLSLSLNRGKIEFDETTNLNIIYQDLLEAIYEREWENKRKHPTIQDIELDDFVRILEEIALAVWHGDGRTTTVAAIESYCEDSGLQDLLTIFNEGVATGINRLLLAFYFRQYGHSAKGEETFEFVHKSFGEYLTAKRIIRELKKIDRQLRRKKEDPDDGWDEREALVSWAKLCGVIAIDSYLFSFIANEIAFVAPTKKLAEAKERVRQWQQTLSSLISFMLLHGMPMERLNCSTYKEANTRSRNAEEALLVVLSACGIFTQKLSSISWKSKHTFRRWLARLQNTAKEGVDIFVHNSLAWLNLEGVNLVRANLAGADLTMANLVGANLVRANLTMANLMGANLVRANLEDANLEDANLEGANLERANLMGANLERANLEMVNLEGAYLVGSNVEKAKISPEVLRRILDEMPE